MGLRRNVTVIVDRVSERYAEEAQQRREKGLEEVLERRKAREEKAEQERLAGWARRAAAEKQMADAGRVRREQQAEGLQRISMDWGQRLRQLQGQVKELEQRMRLQRSAVLDGGGDDAALALAGGLLFGLRERLEAVQAELRAHEASRPRL